MPFTYATVDQYLAHSEAGGLDALDLSTLDNPNETSPNDTQLAEALAQGTRDIEGLLATRFPVAILRAAVPALPALVDINITLARYFLDVRYGAREDVRKRYEDALARLRRITRGEEQLILEDGTLLEVPSEAAPKRGRVGRGQNTFSRGSVTAIMGWNHYY